jgi:hypothetical protein
VRDLASKASKVLDGTIGWSRQDCMGFCKELNWELQAFSKTNTELELYTMPTDRRQAALQRAERVGAAVHHTGQVVERILQDYDCKWRESQRLWLDHHHRLLHTDESWGQVGPQRIVQAARHDQAPM